ncbi:MAG: trypsin-like peptidase domain-containing protein, partial [Treponema sp.]|nr:trypsin-like peptidase domain-containing protein [Treponema sp.]
VFVAEDGNNYILTNFHVISQSQSKGLTIAFETVEGKKTIFSDLSIIAADEDIDIALLVFANNQKPFAQGLSFHTEALEEGDDVYSAGFPGLGTAMVWQLGRGMVSNAQVRLPDYHDESKIIGPFIQHTAQVDPGNSGGPLLVQKQNVPSGFAVAGINTLSAIYRQAANFSIPLFRVQEFLNENIINKAVVDISTLEARVNYFIKGLSDKKDAYPYISSFLSNTCTAENADYALTEMINKANKNIQDDIVGTFVRSPVEGMSYAVAWTIEHAIRTKSGNIIISITKDSIEAIDSENYYVDFNVNGKNIRSEWTSEYGIWRISKFGTFAAGDKSLVKKQNKTNENLRAYPEGQISLYYVNIFNRGSAFGIDITVRENFIGYGIKTNFTKNFFQIEAYTGLYFPIPANKIAFTPFINIGIGMQRLKNVKYKEKPGSSPPQFYSGPGKLFFLQFPLQAGLQITTVIPGLYFQAAYQRNFISDFSERRNTTASPDDKHALFIGLGYSF